MRGELELLYGLASEMECLEVRDLFQAETAPLDPRPTVPGKEERERVREIE